MAKKQTPVTETATAAPRRVAKPRAPRVTAATHSKNAAPVEVVPATPAPVVENSSEVIAALAYGYWEARGRQGGSATEDWLCAEREYRKLVAARS